MNIIAYTDGFTEINPGNGSYYWAVIDWQNDEVIEEFGERVDNTTNNRMELSAVLSLLNHYKEKCDFTIYSDSQYVVNGINSWMYKWSRKRGGFNNKKNPDLWHEIFKLCQFHTVKMIWVKGHNGIRWNEYCDQKCLDVFAVSDPTINYYVGFEHGINKS